MDPICSTLTYRNTCLVTKKSWSLRSTLMRSKLWTSGSMSMWWRCSGIRVVPNSWSALTFYLSSILWRIKQIMKENSVFTSCSTRSWLTVVYHLCPTMQHLTSLDSSGLAIPMLEILHANLFSFSFSSWRSRTFWFNRHLYGSLILNN